MAHPRGHTLDLGLSLSGQRGLPPSDDSGDSAHA